MRFVFKTEDGEISVPEDFCKVSNFLKDYIAAFSSSDREASCTESSRLNRTETDESTTLTVPSVKTKHLQLIFELVERMRNFYSLNYQKAIEDETLDLEKIKQLPVWAQVFFKVIDRDDVILIANASNFLAVAMVVRYVMLFFVNQVVESVSAPDACEIMNLRANYSPSEPLAFRRHTSEFNGNWNCMIDAATPHFYRGKSKNEKEEFSALNTPTTSSNNARVLRPISGRQSKEERFGAQRFNDLRVSNKKSNVKLEKNDFGFCVSPSVLTWGQQCFSNSCNNEPNAQKSARGSKPRRRTLPSAGNAVNKSMNLFDSNKLTNKPSAPSGLVAANN